MAGQKGSATLQCGRRLRTALIAAAGLAACATAPAGVRVELVDPASLLRPRTWS